GWLHPSRSPGFTASRLSYATRTKTQHQAAVKVPGSFRPAAGNEHLYSYCNFAESLVETVPKSLRHSCRSELTRQGISLRRPPCRHEDGTISSTPFVEKSWL